MVLLYNLLVKTYALAIRLSALWNPKAKKWIDGRKNLIQQIESLLDPKQKKIWMHCPSLGEFEQGRTLLEALRTQFPETQIVVTFFSPSGYEIQKNYPMADHIFYLPIDSCSNARRMVQAINPSLAIFIKYDFWLHYLEELKHHGTKTILVSGIFRSGQHFFSGFNQIGRRMLSCFDHFFVQDEQSVKLLRKAGYSHVTKSGDTRFDRVKKLVDLAEVIDRIKAFCNDHFTVVAGSTWPADEKFLLPLINNPAYEMKWIIAPHEISETHLHQLEQQIIKPSVRFSNRNESVDVSPDVMLIDNIGWLSRIYRYADFAYVGGGFGKSIHNILEAAAWGAPVIFGPRHEKFAEATGLMVVGGAKSIRSGTELEKVFSEWYSNPQVLNQASEAACTYVSRNAGATEIVLAWIESNYDSAR